MDLNDALTTKIDVIPTLEDRNNDDFGGSSSNNNGSNIVNDECDELWIFGYGSLIWKVDFPIERSQTGHIKGFLRRFYQNSIDHRGTPVNPGRVVTLIPSNDPNSKVFGVAYQIPNKKKEQVLNHLDHREKNGYEKHFVNFYADCDSDGTVATIRRICIYVATNENESFAGQTDDMKIIAKQIFYATGPSGKNIDYVFNLANAMRELFPNEIDHHLFELEAILKLYEKSNCVIAN